MIKIESIYFLKYPDDELIKILNDENIKFEIKFSMPLFGEVDVSTNEENKIIVVVSDLDKNKFFITKDEKIKLVIDRIKKINIFK